MGQIEALAHTLPAKSKTEFLSLGTAPTGGAFFVVGGAIGETLNENKGDNNWTVTAEATRGSQENIRRLASGEIDFALANAAISYFAIRGEEGWDQAYPIRTIMTLAPNVALVVTPESSGVKTIADLKGKRVVIGPAGAGFEFFVRPLLGAHGVTYDDMEVLHGAQTAVQLARVHDRVGVLQEPARQALDEGDVVEEGPR